MSMENTMQGKRILFFIPEGNIVSNGLYISQVLGLIRYCASCGAECLVFQSYIEAKEEVVEFEPNIRVVSDCRQYGYVPFVFQPRLYWNMIRRHLKVIDVFRPTHIYTRQYLSCLAARKLSSLLNAKLIMSRRGAEVAERLIGGRFKDHVAAFLMKFAISKAIKGCSHINTVCSYLARNTEEDYGKQTSVLPCCVQDYAFERMPHDWILENRAKMGLNSSDKVMVYSGGVNAWQRIDEVVALMKEIHKRDGAIRFIFLSKEVEAIRGKCQAVNLPENVYHIRSCAHKEVSSYLQLADCGVILRANTIVNRAASPIKIGEYLAAGLGIIAQPWIGDVGERIIGRSFACKYEDISDTGEVLEFIHGLTDADKEAARTFARGYYSYDGNKAAVIKMFS